MQEYRVTVDDKGTIKYYKPGTEGLHRLDGPAVQYADGTECWYQNDKRHRLDGPAIEYANGEKYWFQNNQFHRLDGPAVELVDGSKLWYQDDKLHRLDGPAIESANGSVAYWIDGEQLTLAQFKKKTAPKPKEMTIAEIEAILVHSVKVVK